VLLQQGEGGGYPEIVEEHLLKGRIVDRLLYHEAAAGDETVKSLNETKFYKKQHRIAQKTAVSLTRKH
jgi:hypothetical protein